MTSLRWNGSARPTTVRISRRTENHPGMSPLRHTSPRSVTLACAPARARPHGRRLPRSTPLTSPPPMTDRFLPHTPPLSTRRIRSVMNRGRMVCRTRLILGEACQACQERRPGTGLGMGAGAGTCQWAAPTTGTPRAALVWPGSPRPRVQARAGIPACATASPKFPAASGPTAQRLSAPLRPGATGRQPTTG